MPNETTVSRPHVSEALSYWRKLLSERGLPTEMLWIFDENLCFEATPESPSGFRLAFQVELTPPPQNADEIAYGFFSESDARLVFYRIGSSRGRSICVMLCDKWLEQRGPAEGYIRRDDWGMSFRPGMDEGVPEVTDPERWEKRLLKNRPLHDLDFCLELRAMHELVAHGRVLTTYEHYALKFLHPWARILNGR
jgi:hypothetical protein